MNENFSRNDLAKKFKTLPIEEREAFLNKEKEKPEYWNARTSKIKERQKEEEIDGGLGVLVKNKTIYHGSGISEIKKFDPAEDTTVGSGVYFTSEAKDAIGYAKIRAKGERNERRADGKQVIKNAQPIIYEASIKNMKLCDLRKNENVKKISIGYRKILLEKVLDPNTGRHERNAANWVIEKIDEGIIRAGVVKEMAQTNGELFSNYIKSLGYEGLIALEGGEDGNGNHDTYLIFDPDKIKIIEEHKITE